MSKNDMGDLRMFFSMELWRVREAKMADIARQNEAKRTNMD